VTELTSPTSQPAQLTIPASLAQQVADIQYDWTLPEADLRALILTSDPIDELATEQLLVGYVPTARVPEGLRDDVEIRNATIAVELLSRGIEFTVETAA
jgi:hypothetical protein